MIYIVTACSRPENLPIVAATIPRQCRWLIVFDSKVKDPPHTFGDIRLRPAGVTGSNYVLINHVLDTFLFQPNDWLYDIDDDNIVHPRWYSRVAPLCTPHNNLITWGQYRHYKCGWRPTMPPTKYPREGRIDFACYTWRYGFNPTLRFERKYDADGAFARQLGPVSVRLQQYLAYYNYIKKMGVNLAPKSVITT